MADAATPPYERAGRVVHRSELDALGITAASARWLVHRRRWRVLLPGVYLTREEPRPDDWRRAALLHCGPDSVLSGATALQKYGVRLPRAADADSILVLIRYNLGVRPVPPVWVRRVPHLPRQANVDGLRLAPVARAAADLALGLRRPDDVRALVADIVQRGFCTPDDLVAELASTARKHSKPFRTAVEEVRGGARSAPEARAAVRLRVNGLTGFVQNARVHAAGRSFVADFLWEDLLAILEVDGADYHFARSAWTGTLDRDAMLQSAGYVVLHVTPTLVANETMFVKRVGDWLAARSHSLMITRISSL